MSTTSQPDARTFRSFGLVVGSVFLLIAVWPQVRGHGDVRTWAMVLGATLVIAALVAPSALRYPYHGWMRLGAVLGWINSRIILGGIFFLIITPMALWRRMRGQDALALRPEPESATYRVQSDARQPDHLLHQF
jgi:hypothetical protein